MNPADWHRPDTLGERRSHVGRCGHDHYLHPVDYRRVATVEPLAGIAFVVFFLLSVVISSPPAANAPDSRWTADYTGTSHQVGHLLTGIFLLLAALSLLTFLTGFWRHIAAHRPPGQNSPLPLIAAGVAAACIATGGMLQAFVSGSELTGKYPLPNADILRLGDLLGFTLVGVAGMAVTAFCIACLTAQGRKAGVLGPKMTVFGYVVSVALLAAVAFLPIALLLVWLVIVAVRWMRTTPSTTPSRNSPRTTRPARQHRHVLSLGMTHRPDQTRTDARVRSCISIRKVAPGAAFNVPDGRPSGTEAPPGYVFPHRKAHASPTRDRTRTKPRAVHARTAEERDLSSHLQPPRSLRCLCTHVGRACQGA